MIQKWETAFRARFASGKDKIYKETGTIESNIDNNQLILDGGEHT